MHSILANNGDLHISAKRPTAPNQLNLSDIFGALSFFL